MPVSSAALVALAAICWGVSGGLAGYLLAQGWDPFVVSFYRAVVGLLFVAAWLCRHTRGHGLDDPRLWLWSVVAGLGVAGNFAFYFLSIAEGSVAVAATLMYCAPVFVYLVSFALGLEKPSPSKFCAIVLVIVGILLLTGVYDANPGGISLFGVAAGLLAGLSYAVFIFGFKYAAFYGTSQSALVIVFALVSMLLFWLGDDQQRLNALTADARPLFLTLGLLGAGLSFIFFVVGLKFTPPAIASILAMVEPVTASLFSVLVLGETLAGLQLTGMGLVIATVTGLSVISARGRRKHLS